MGFRGRIGRRGFGRGRSVRGMDWAGASLAATLEMAPGTITAGYIVAPSTVRTEYTDPTLTRTRGRFSFQSNSVFLRAAVGIIEWPDTDDTAPGVSDVPNPQTNLDMDWLWHSFVLVARVATGTIDSDKLIEIDSRAQRKLGNNKGILLVVTNAAASSANMAFNYGVRCLLKDG